MIAINKTNPTTLKTYVLLVFIFFAGFVSYGQEVDESFDAYTDNDLTNIDYYNFFEINGAQSTSVARSGRAVQLSFSSGPKSIEYLGSDGNGKDVGIGNISFWFKGIGAFEYIPNPFYNPFGPFDPIFNPEFFEIPNPFEQYRVQYSLNGGANYTNVGGLITTKTDTWLPFNQDVNVEGDDILVRIINVGSGQRFYVDDFKITNFILTATWTGTTWDWNKNALDGTTPTFPQKAKIIVNGNYNTASGGIQTSFGGNDLTVNAGASLVIADNTYVELENNITVNGNVEVRSKGSFVQVNDGAVVNGSVLSSPGRIKVQKNTAPLTVVNEYTYWSSPVVGETIATGLDEANPSRIYYYEAQNYRDSDRLINNAPAGAGQDDIDDNGDDWQFASGATVMQPGVGYAALNQFGFPSPTGVQYEFEGPFNNGAYNVPIYRNDAETMDNNWNFIGNPYPSAIDVNAFLDANSSITDVAGATTGAIFLWSQATAIDLSGNENGNETYNYAASDYAIMNRTGGAAGGDGEIPLPFIPSGQGFFVAMDNAASSTTVSGSIETTDVVFNNSMRVTGNNNQFFRSSINDQPNKLWIDLTSDNGVFNQILIAYVDGATDGDDGMSFDADKNLSSGTFASLYSTIAGAGDKKFAIQGKNPSSLGLEEVISVGFITSIPVPTLYTLSIRKTEGTFMTENTIYLKDNLLNLTHELSSSDYTFTSETGEFNERFEIVFSAESLSIDDNQIGENTLTITELDSGEVAFNVGKANSISKVTIYDMLGRPVYDLSGSSSREVYNLSNLGNAPYVAQVTLDNGQVISKKAIKRN